MQTICRHCKFICNTDFERITHFNFCECPNAPITDFRSHRCRHDSGLTAERTSLEVGRYRIRFSRLTGRYSCGWIGSRRSLRQPAHCRRTFASGSELRYHGRIFDGLVTVGSWTVTHGCGYPGVEVHPDPHRMHIFLPAHCRANSEFVMGKCETLD